MKKISILICVLMALGINASAADIEENISLRKVSITVSNTLKVEKPTIQILDQNKSRVLYTAEGVFSDDKYVFEDFSMPADAESGSYIVRIGENGKIHEKEIYYASYAELVQAVESAMASGMTAESLVENYADVFNVNKTEFKGFSPEWKNRFTKEIQDIELSTESDENIKLSIDKLKGTFLKWTNLAYLLTTTDLEKLDNAVAYFTELDVKYYGMLSDKTCIRKGAESVQYDAETISEAEIFELFDGGVLTGIITQTDWATGKEALNYYVNKGLISVEPMYLNAGASVYKALKNKKTTNYNNLASDLRNCYEMCAANASNVGGSATGGRGTGNKVSVGDVLTPNSIVQENNAKNIFDDISDVEWAREAIEGLADEGIISGKADRKFAPNDAITRAEFVKIIVLAFDINGEAEISFTDVPLEAWYYEYVASAKNSNIIYGISDTYFGANEYITRQDMTVIIKRIVDIYKIYISGEGIKFLDEAEISGYALEAVSSLSGAGIIQGMGDGTFSPKSYVTRAQAAKVIYDITCRKGN